MSVVMFYSSCEWVRVRIRFLFKSIDSQEYCGAYCKENCSKPATRIPYSLSVVLSIKSKNPSVKHGYSSHIYFHKKLILLMMGNNCVWDTVDLTILFLNSFAKVSVNPITMIAVIKESYRTQ